MPLRAPRSTARATPCPQKAAPSANSAVRFCSRRAVVAATLFATTIGACGREQRSTAAGAPVVECREATYDFGKPVQGQELKHDFALFNRGDRELRLLGVDRAYSCVGEASATTVPPGRSATVRVVCDIEHFNGKMADEISVRTNDPSHPKLKLTLVADVEPLLAFEASDVRFELAFGEKAVRELRLVGARARQAQLVRGEQEQGAPEVELLPATDTRPAGIRVSASGTAVERRVGQLRFRTGIDEPRELGLVYSLAVEGNLSVDPTNPYFNLREPPPRERVVTVQSKRSDFVLHAAEILEGPFRTRMSHDEANHRYAVHVSFVDAALPAKERGAMGKLLLVSNDPAEPRKQVPLFALGVRRDPQP